VLQIPLYTYTHRSRPSSAKKFTRREWRTICAPRVLDMCFRRKLKRGIPPVTTRAAKLCASFLVLHFLGLGTVPRRKLKCGYISPFFCLVSLTTCARALLRPLVLIYYVYTHLFSQIHTLSLSLTHTHAGEHTRANTRARTHTHTHVHTNAHAHTHTYINMHLGVYPEIMWVCVFIKYTYI